jgi:hypothetical protein
MTWQKCQTLVPSPRVAPSSTTALGCTYTLIVVPQGAAHGLGDARHVVGVELAVHRDREHLGGGALGLGKVTAAVPEVRHGALQRHGHGVVHLAHHAAGLERRLERVAPRVTHGELRVDVSAGGVVGGEHERVAHPGKARAEQVGVGAATREAGLVVRELGAQYGGLERVEPVVAARQPSCTFLARGAGDPRRDCMVSASRAGSSVVHAPPSPVAPEGLGGKEREARDGPEGAHAAVAAGRRRRPGRRLRSPRGRAPVAESRRGRRCRRSDRRGAPRGWPGCAASRGRATSVGREVEGLEVDVGEHRRRARCAGSRWPRRNS